MNSPTDAAPSPPLADLSLNCVIRRASPKPVRHCSTQPSWAWAGTWDCTKIAERSGSIPIASSCAAARRVRSRSSFGVLLDGDRVQVGDEEERLVAPPAAPPTAGAPRGSCRSGRSRPSAGSRRGPGDAGTGGRTVRRRACSALSQPSVGRCGGPGSGSLVVAGGQIRLGGQRGDLGLLGALGWYDGDQHPSHPPVLHVAHHDPVPVEVDRRRRPRRAGRAAPSGSPRPSRTGPRAARSRSRPRSRRG